jgi:hypothetical protein
MKAQCLSGTQKLVSNRSEQHLAGELDLESLKDVVAEAYRPDSKGRALLEMAFGHAPQFMVVCDILSVWKSASGNGCRLNRFSRR